MNLKRTLKRNPIAAFLLGGFLISVGFSLPEIQANTTALGRIKQIAQANTTKQLELQASEQAKRQSALIAESRYESGCIPVVASNDPNSLTAITEGSPVIDRIRGVPLSAGQIVCDANGLTGEIILNAQGQPVVGKTAFTGNRTIIDQRMAEVAASYQVPGVQ